MNICFLITPCPPADFPLLNLSACPTFGGTTGGMEEELGHSRQPKKKLFYEWYINSKIQRSAVINVVSPRLIKRDIEALKGRNSITRVKPREVKKNQKRRQKVTKSGEVCCALFAKAPVRAVKS